MNFLDILKFDENQPRKPKGTPEGGQFASTGGKASGGGVMGGPGAGSTLDGTSAALLRDKNMEAAALRGVQAALKNKGLDPSMAEQLLARGKAIEKEVEDNYTKNATEFMHKLKNGDWTPERRDLHTKILEEFFANEDRFKPPTGEPPQVLLLAGRPGSGKSNFGKALKIYDKESYIVLDSDEFKALLPEYDPERPGYTHREASDLMDTAGLIARAKGLNIVYDMTMKKPPDDLITMFKNHGYKIEGHQMDVSEETSAERAYFRWVNDGQNGTPGRLVPLSIIKEMKKIPEVFKATASKLDAWTHYTHENLGEQIRVAASEKYRVAKAFLKRILKGVTR